MVVLEKWIGGNGIGNGNVKWKWKMEMENKRDGRTGKDGKVNKRSKWKNGK